MATDYLGSHYECAMDPGDVGQDELPYDQSITLGSITCTSRDTGVTCDNTATGAGFMVSREGVLFY